MKANRVWLMACAIVIAAFCLFTPPIRQDETYHLFADARILLGIPNFWNIVSNAPFLVIGYLGLRKFPDLLNRALFAGVFLTGAGSAYYHFAPSDARLVWDRLPMTLIFMSFLACVVSKGKTAKSERVVLLTLLTIGIGSVIWWRLTNDLRPYAIVKFGPLPLLLPYLLSSDDRRDLIWIVALFGMAQIAELTDKAIYALTPLSGHTVKHLLAALATYIAFRWRTADALRVSSSRQTTFAA